MSELFNIEGKCFIITGGTGTLGGSISEYLIMNKANVILLGRTETKLKTKNLELNELNLGNSSFYVVDVLNEEALKEVREKILSEYKTIDGLINLAGGNQPGATLREDQNIFDIKVEDTRNAVDINLYGTMIPSLVFGELFANQKFGSIINISSMASKSSITRVLGYSMAKSSVDIFTKWLAQELSSKFSDKIRVNAIAPGFFIGEQNKNLLTEPNGELTSRGKKIIANTPMNRFGDASELNGMVHYFLSDASSFVTGSIFEVDGGFSSFSGV